MDNPNTEPAQTPADRVTSGELTVADRQMNILRDKLRNVDRQLAAASQNNTKLVSMLETAKAEITRL